MCVRSYATLGSYFTFLSIGFKKLKALGTRTQSYLIFKDAELNKLYKYRYVHISQ